MPTTDSLNLPASSPKRDLRQQVMSQAQPAGSLINFPSLSSSVLKKKQTIGKGGKLKTKHLKPKKKIVTNRRSNQSGSTDSSSRMVMSINQCLHNKFSY